VSTNDWLSILAMTFMLSAGGGMLLGFGCGMHFERNRPKSD